MYEKPLKHYLAEAEKKIDSCFQLPSPSSTANIEIKRTETAVFVRNKTNPEHVLVFSRNEWNEFVEAIKKGRFNV